MSCKNVPVSCVLATTDDKLYNEKTGWKWSGKMYWSVNCLESGQLTVSDMIAPKIQKENYLQLDKSPSMWDFCKSGGCTRETNFLHIVFTFNPGSTNPADYLQYVVSINNKVIDLPRYSIKDSNGKNLYIDIIQISSIIHEPYVELWIAKGQTGLVQDESTPVDIVDGGGNKLVVWILIVLVVLVVLGILVAAGYMLFWKKIFLKTKA